MSDLLPCPFCSGEAEFSMGKTGDGKDWHYIECTVCEAMGPHVQYADHQIRIKEALADAWNTRALPAVQPDARIEALQASNMRLSGMCHDLTAERDRLQAQVRFFERKALD